MKLSLCLIALIATLTGCISPRKIKQEFKPTFSVSKKTTHKISKDQKFIFGYLEVLENRKKINGNTIKLPVYIFKSRNPNPPKDPIIYTVGGPGSTTMPSAQYMKFYKYLDDRDFILFEQRGNYYAKPHLGCPEWSEAVYQSNLPGCDSARSDALFAEAATSCRDRLVKSGIDLNAYNTNEIAADINDLVKVLGIEEYNLLTMSYSTKIAQVLLRDYPERIRSVVMDSPLPLEVNYDEESVGNLMDAVEQMLSDCEAEKECSDAFPNLKERFYAFLREKTTSPLVVQVQNPGSGKEETFYLKGEDLITVFSSASTNEVADIPFEINKLLNGDLSTVRQRLASLFKGPGPGDGMGMRLSVWCSEENPFNSQDVIKNETWKYPEVAGLSPVTVKNEICEIWSVRKSAAIENEPVTSDVPVLLISGGYDETTPPKWAASMSSNFPNSKHLVFEGWKHGPITNWSNPCAMQAANDFFNQPNQKPAPECLEKIKLPKFRTE